MHPFRKRRATRLRSLPWACRVFDLRTQRKSVECSGRTAHPLADSQGEPGAIGEQMTDRRLDRSGVYESGTTAGFSSNRAVPSIFGSLPHDLIDLGWAALYTGQDQKVLIRLSRKGQFPGIYDFGGGAYRVSEGDFGQWVADSRLDHGDESARQSARFRRDRGGRGAS